jgi:hypothetical protein
VPEKKSEHTKVWYKRHRDAIRERQKTRRQAEREAKRKAKSDLKAARLAALQEVVLADASPLFREKFAARAAANQPPAGQSEKPPKPAA